MRFWVAIGLVISAGLSAGYSILSPDLSDRTPDSQVKEPTLLNSAQAQSPPTRLSLKQKYCENAQATTCSTSWPSADPTGIVQPDAIGEIRALRKMRGLIQKNPSWTSEQVQEQLVKEIYTEKRRSLAFENFEWVRKHLVKSIENQPASIFSDGEKEVLKGRIEKVVLELPPPASVYSDSADLVTKNTVYYERTPKGELRLRVGGAYLLTANSKFNMIYTFAHELAHAIDPCETHFANVSPRQYPHLISCFIEAGWIEKERAHCGRDEQVSEAFADWMAAGIVGDAIEEFGKRYSQANKVRSAINATRDLCEQSSRPDALDLRAHQQPNIRIGSIMGENPKVKKSLDCSFKENDIRYCNFQILKDHND